MKIKCAVCGEPSGGEGTSMYGHVHAYGPTKHAFRPVYMLTRSTGWYPSDYTIVVPFQTIRINKSGVNAFDQGWPGSVLPSRAITFMFDRNGDLVDIYPDSRDFDSHELAVLSQDAQLVLNIESERRETIKRRRANGRAR